MQADGRPPILLCLDGLNHIMQNSEYRAPDFSPIYAHDLAIIRWFVDHLSDSKKLSNGGAVLAATTKSHGPISTSLSLSIRQAIEKQLGLPLTQKDPFERKYDPRAEKAMIGVEAIKLTGISKSEARALMEYWAKSGVFRARVDEAVVTEKWALAGNGVVGEIQRGALNMRF
jgi:small subunit ribosomal protein S29